MKVSSHEYERASLKIDLASEVSGTLRIDAAVFLALGSVPATNK